MTVVAERTATSGRGPRWLRLLAGASLAAGLMSVAPMTQALASPASVAITSHDAQVSGSAAVTVTGHTDPEYGDHPVSMGLLLNGTLVSQVWSPADEAWVAGAVPCELPKGVTVCTLSEVYSVGSFVGAGTLSVRMTSAQGVVVTGGGVPVTVAAMPDPPVSSDSCRAVMHPAAGR